MPPKQAKASPIARPSYDYAKKLAERAYTDDDKSKREEERRRAAEVRQKAREEGKDVDLGKAGHQWEQAAEAKSGGKGKQSLPPQPLPTAANVARGGKGLGPSGDPWMGAADPWSSAADPWSSSSRPMPKQMTQDDAKDLLSVRDPWNSWASTNGVPGSHCGHAAKATTATIPRPPMPSPPKQGFQPHHVDNCLGSQCAGFVIPRNLDIRQMYSIAEPDPPLVHVQQRHFPPDVAAIHHVPAGDGYSGWHQKGGKGKGLNTFDQQGGAMHEHPHAPYYATHSSSGSTAAFCGAGFAPYPDEAELPRYYPHASDGVPDAARYAQAPSYMASRNMGSIPPPCAWTAGAAAQHVGQLPPLRLTNTDGAITDDALHKQLRDCEENMAQQRVSPKIDGVIDLAGNRITDEGVELLVNFLRREKVRGVETMCLLDNPTKSPVSLAYLLEDEVCGLRGCLRELRLTESRLSCECLWRILEKCNRIKPRPPFRLYIYDEARQASNLHKPGSCGGSLWRVVGLAEKRGLRVGPRDGPDVDIELLLPHRSLSTFRPPSPNRIVYQ